MQLQELGSRFSEVSTSLIENMSGLNHCNSFAKFDISKIVKFSEMYPNDFNKEERGCLPGDLSTFYHTSKEDDKFANLTGLSDLVRVMVETGKNETFPLVHRTLKLALILPVATATVERCFSKMKLIKTDLRNRMGDEYLNNDLICAVEKECFCKVKEEDVMARFPAFKNRRGELT
ncbi:putative HAT dimerization domain, ribonuclease H-like superfamily [Helianthus annuus]|nr:putative HAT dimerization domain, ribonuclease H-like superfamily [Helianthus annuus]